MSVRHRPSDETMLAYAAGTLSEAQRLVVETHLALCVESRAWAGKLEQLPGERATISDWANHISTIFPEVRLKRYLEMRGADGGPWRRLPALPAFWVGILYDDAALDAAWDIVKAWSADERQKLRDDVPKLGFAATIRNRTMLSLAQETLKLAREGLTRRRRLNAGRDPGSSLR